MMAPGLALRTSGDEDLIPEEVAEEGYGWDVAYARGGDAGSGPAFTGARSLEPAHAAARTAPLAASAPMGTKLTAGPVPAARELAPPAQAAPPVAGKARASLVVKLRILKGFVAAAPAPLAHAEGVAIQMPIAEGAAASQAKVKAEQKAVAMKQAQKKPAAAAATNKKKKKKKKETKPRGIHGKGRAGKKIDRWVTQAMVDYMRVLKRKGTLRNGNKLKQLSNEDIWVKMQKEFHMEEKAVPTRSTIMRYLNGKTKAVDHKKKKLTR